MNGTDGRPIAFQGEPGAFSHVAARHLLGESVQVLPCQRFEEAFRAVAGQQAAAAVIPIENTLHGSVHENYDHLLQFDLEIRAETRVRISHALIAHPEARREDIRQVYSHPVALNQCHLFFARHPELERVPFYDTAGSVKMLMAEHRRDAAGIASEIAASTYGAQVLEQGIEDDRQNFTRFFLLTRRDSPLVAAAAQEQDREWKTSLVFTTKNTAGALFRALSAFALRDLSLSKIESRPLRGKPWEYLFYLDFVGRQEEPAAQKALGHLEELADFLRVLGSYPRHV